jgi:hypothetical protein
MSPFDCDVQHDLLVQEDDEQRAAAERALHEPRDDDRLARCPVCNDPVGVRCCVFGGDR